MTQSIPSEPIAAGVHPITEALERDGIVVLPGLLDAERLKLSAIDLRGVIRPRSAS